jgi:hypothetical protein
MELCSIEDAFPKIGGYENSEQGLPMSPSGCLDSKPSKEERRAAKKKAKKCKGPALEYLDAQEGKVPDPDRPAVKRLGDVPAFVSYAEAFPDISGSFEGFSIPKLTSASCATNTEGLPKYFLRGDDDEEGFANYSGMQGDNPGYQLVPTAIPAFDGNGVEKAGSLPAPNMDVNWKPINASKATTSYYDAAPLAVDSTNVATGVKTSGVVPTPSTVKREPAIVNDQRDMLLKQISELTKRLDDLEHKQPARDTQKELLMFVGTGIFLLVSFDLALRASR